MHVNGQLSSALCGLVLVLMGLAQAQSPPDTAWVYCRLGQMGDGLRTVCETNEGWFAAVGTVSVNNSVNTDGALLVVDSKGHEVTYRVFDREDNNTLGRVFESSDCGLILSGAAINEGNWSAWIIKTDSRGDTIWSEVLDDEILMEASWVHQTSDNGLVVAGTRRYQSAQAIGTAIVKLDSSRQIVFNKVLHLVGATHDRIQDAEVDPRGGYLILGESVDLQDTIGYRSWVMEVDSAGNRGFLHWLDPRIYCDLEVYPNGDFGLGGQWDDSTIFLSRQNRGGYAYWTQTYSLLDGRGKFGDCKLTPDGGFVVTGEGRWFGYHQMFWFKTDEVGNVQWTVVRQVMWEDSQPLDVIVTSDSGYCIAATVTSYGPGGGASMCLIRTEPDSVLRPVVPSIPACFTLYQNFPNPFNPITEIRFDLLEALRVELKIFNTLGQLVTTLVDEARPAGVYRILWDSRNAAGVPMASGVYVYQLRAGNFTDAKKMVLIR